MFVYAIRGGAYAKVGVSDDIEKRLASFNGGAVPFEVRVICLGETDTTSAVQIEADILEMLPGRLRGEWLDGAISDADIAQAFSPWPWSGPLLFLPTPQQIAEVNRATAMRRQLEASRAVAAAFEAGFARPPAKTPPILNWHKTATEMVARGDMSGLRRIKKAFKAKRLAAQNRVSR